MSMSSYGMSFNPFNKEIETKHTFMTKDMNEMDGRLDYIKNNPGIAVFTAGSGQGKTFSLRRFSHQLNPNITKFAYICLSTVTTAEFYRQLCSQLGLEVQSKKSLMFKSIQEYLENLSMNKKIHQIICLDEAQYLNTDILRDLKMLTNFSMDSKNCFTLILLGQPVLKNILMRQPHESLRQRIVINYSFTGIEESEAMEYIKNRLELAGASASIIDENAMLSAYLSSSGSIRKLNLIMTTSLC